MWLSHDCAVPSEKKGKKKKGKSLGGGNKDGLCVREELLCKRHRHWAAAYSLPAKVSPIGCGSASSTAAAVVKNCLSSFPPSPSLSLFPASSPHINNCLGITGVDHTCHFKDVAFHCILQHDSYQVSLLLSAPCSSGELK